MSAPPAQKPPAEFAVDAALVCRLLATQHPDLAHLPVNIMSEGWDNTIFHVGDGLLARLPRRAVAVPLLRNEQTWLPRLAPRLPLPIPAPVRIGTPQADFPYPWSVTPFLAGAPVGGVGLRADQGTILGQFFRALHQTAPPEAPANPNRGVPLARFSVGDADRLMRLGDLVPDPVRVALFQGAEAPPHDGLPVMLHGDPHPFNVLAQDGRISSLIDWGDLCAGDPATDLAAFWMLLPDAAARSSAIDAYGGLAQPLLARARGWAARFAIMFLEIGRTNGPHFAPVAGATFARLL